MRIKYLFNYKIFLAVIILNGYFFPDDLILIQNA